MTSATLRCPGLAWPGLGCAAFKQFRQAGAGNTLTAKLLYPTTLVLYQGPTSQEPHLTSPHEIVTAVLRCPFLPLKISIITLRYPSISSQLSPLSDYLS